MSTFRDDPYWQRYWHDELRDRKISMYVFAPFFELVGALLRTSASLEPEFRRRRKSALKSIAADMSQRSYHLREQGIGWLSNATKAGWAYSDAIHRRVYHGVEGEIVQGVATARALLSAATAFMFLFEPTFVRAHREHNEESGFIGWYFDQLESLTDLCADPCVPDVHPTVLRLLGQYAIMQECEGLAFQQAMIEDGFNKRTRRSLRQKATPNMERVTELAALLGVDPEMLRDVFSREYSGWWGMKESYVKEAESVRQRITGLTSVDRDRQLIAGIELLDPGSTHLPSAGYPDHCSDEESYLETEKTTKLLIAMFLSVSKSGHTAFLPK